MDSELAKKYWTLCEDVVSLKPSERICQESVFKQSESNTLEGTEKQYLID